MILYHGINTDLSEIDLKKSRPDKDFGRAFISPILGNKLSKWQSADASLQVGEVLLFRNMNLTSHYCMVVA